MTNSTHSLGGPHMTVVAFDGAGGAIAPFDPTSTIIPFHQIRNEEAVALLQSSAYHDEADIKDNTRCPYGSPGTYIMLPTDTHNKWEVVVVNSIGERRTEIVQYIEGRGWKNSTPTIYPNFQELVYHLCGDLTSILGGCPGIPFFTSGQIKLALALLETADAGTYVCFAHAPMETSATGTEAAPGKRNVILWKSSNGTVREAPFHFVQSSDRGIALFKNGSPSVDSIDTDEPMGHYHEGSSGSTGSTGGPITPVRGAREGVLSNRVLEGLIIAKLSKEPHPIPLRLDTIMTGK